MTTLQKLLFLAILLPLASVKAEQPPFIKLTRGMVITQSVQIKKAVYQLNGYDSLHQSVIIVRGNNITIDFNDALLQGSNDKQLPNQFYGLALLIQGDNITLKNARIAGYKIAVMAAGCKNLTIEHSNFSYNYRQQLQSNWLREDVSDWMSYHHNEKDEWLRYGTGMYLKDCIGFTIKNNIVTGGQCALMMMRSNEGKIHDNDFSFNSAIGIGMYKSNQNNILHNKLDFNVRGHSHGFYHRGQDSAGILVFEQCNNNTFAYNSVTHSGDGFFLWAGQTTMDSGQGGCNNNYLYKNDFSYAPTNGIEVTFSSNKIYDNIIHECDHGIWGGYSWNTIITGNIFYKNRIGIAIEHGQHNNISNNWFEGHTQDAVKIWARKIQPTEWGYAKNRDTRSMQYNFLENNFKNEKTALNITLTDDISLYANTFNNCLVNIKKDSSVTAVKEMKKFSDTTVQMPGILTRWKDNHIPPTTFPRGRNQIRITEWGPYNYRYPIIFLKKIDSNKIYHFDILGPKGNWKVIQSANAVLSQSEGKFPAEITAQKTGSDIQLQLQYTGPTFTDQFGKLQTATKPYIFSFRDYQPQMNWNIDWYTWDAAHDPLKNYEQFKTIFSNTPIKTEQNTKLDYTWWGAIGKQLPADSFATVATTTVQVQKGKYNLGITADDLVKVFVDGKLVIDFWDITKYKYDEDTHHDAVVHLGGNHTIRVEHVENKGYSTIIFTLKPL